MKKTVTFALLLLLFLTGCVAIPETESTRQAETDPPHETTEPEIKETEEEKAADISASAVESFQSVFSEAEVRAKKNGDKTEIHVIYDIPENAHIDNWSDVTETLVSMQKSQQENFVVYIETKAGTILATAFNGKLQYDGFGERTKSLEMILAEATLGEKNAYKKALSYLEFSAFSYEGLIDQLEYENFSHSEAVFAADNCGANWNEQAAKKAKSYLEFSAFSRERLIDQLKFEGFTDAEANYGANAVGY